MASLYEDFDVLTSSYTLYMLAEIGYKFESGLAQMAT